MFTAPTRKRSTISRLVAVSTLLLVALASRAAAQQTKPTTGIDDSWDQVIPSGVAQTPPDAVLTPAQVTGKRGAAGDFLNHFFFESRSDYWRYSTSFTGLPSVTYQLNAQPSNIFNPNGIPYPMAFQPDAGRIYTFLDFGTRGYLSDRINTHVAFRYAQDLTHVDTGSAAQNVIETFHGNRNIELVNASLEINGKPTDGIFAGTSLTLGRQYIYGAEVASLDGGAFTVNRRWYELTLFGGRRFTYYSDPDQRLMGGANLIFKLGIDTSLEYDTLWYIRGSNRVAFRRRFGPQWFFSSNFRMYGGAPVDFSAQAMYSPRNARTTVRLSYFQKLTNNDYQYDFTEAARDFAKYNAAGAALLLGPLSPYSQFAIDARRAFSKRLNVGGGVLIRRLNNTQNQGPYDTSFEDYRANVELFPLRKIETLFGYHQRNSDRLAPLNPTAFDDVSHSGETGVKDLTAEVHRVFGEGRLNLSGGVYYRRISLQDRFFYVDKVHQSGWLGSAWVKLDPRTRVYFDYSLDNDFFIFRPDLRNSRVLRVGLAWKY